METKNKRLKIKQIIGKAGYYIDRYEWKDYPPFVFDKEEYHKLMVVDLPSELAVGDLVEFSVHLENIKDTEKDVLIDGWLRVIGIVVEKESFLTKRIKYKIEVWKTFSNNEYLNKLLKKGQILDIVDIDIYYVSRFHWKDENLRNEILSMC